MRRTREHTDAHFGHGRECLWRLHAAAVGVAQVEQNWNVADKTKQLKAEDLSILYLFIYLFIYL
jgi:hypothetical protein